MDFQVRQQYFLSWLALVGGRGGEAASHGGTAQARQCHGSCAQHNCDNSLPKADDPSPMDINMPKRSLSISPIGQKGDEHQHAMLVTGPRKHLMCRGYDQLMIDRYARDSLSSDYTSSDMTSLSSPRLAHAGYSRAPGYIRPSHHGSIQCEQEGVFESGNDRRAAQFAQLPCKLAFRSLSRIR